MTKPAKVRLRVSYEIDSDVSVRWTKADVLSMLEKYGSCWPVKRLRVERIEPRKGEAMSEPSEAAKTKPTIRELLDRVGKGLDTRVLAERVEAVLKLHVPFGIYDECGHEHTDADVIAGTAVDVPEVGVTCEEGKLYDVCRECHLVNDEPTEDCGDPDWVWPCATIRALAAPRGTDE